MWQVRPRESTSPSRKRDGRWLNAEATKVGGGDCGAVTELRDEERVRETRSVPNPLNVRGRED